MTCSLTPFAFDDDLVRIIKDENNNLLFVAKDVALSLGYTWNQSACLAHVPEEWKMRKSIQTVSGEQNMWFLTEQGLYFFLGRSDKPKALPFQKWVAGEVLPSIRKTGEYIAPTSKQHMQYLGVPPEAFALRPTQREKSLNLALQFARQTGVVDPESIQAIFVEMCILLGNGATVGMYNSETKDVEAFAKECLAPHENNELKASIIYNRFVMWWHDQKKERLPLSIHSFGSMLGTLYRKQKRGGNVYYRNVTFSSHI